MKKITIIWTIMLILILGILTVFGLHLKQEMIYELMEEAMLTKTKEYLKKNKDEYPKLNHKVTIELDKLIDNEFNPKLENGCNGYTVVKNKEDGFHYKSYIKCPDYITNGYKDSEKE